MKRTRVQNFAAQNAKTKSRVPAIEKTKANAENLGNLFVRMIVVVSEKTSLDLRKIISYPITTYPLSLAHCDGAHMKTEKSALLRKLESLQTETITDAQLPRSYVQVYDGGLLLHSVLLQTATGALYASMARTMWSVLCSRRASEVHVCMDKYVENSIKDSERKTRGNTGYVITGPEQKIRQSGKKPLTNGVFKNEFAKFLLKEWKKTNYWNIFDHVIVRASDTDVLVIPIGATGQESPNVWTMADIIMDCGMGNSRRYINVTNIADVLEERRPGLARALPGYHAFTGCDFTSAFGSQIIIYYFCKQSLLKTIRPHQTLLKNRESCSGKK